MVVRPYMSKGGELRIILRVEVSQSLEELVYSYMVGATGCPDQHEKDLWPEFVEKTKRLSPTKILKIVREALARYGDERMPYDIGDQGLYELSELILEVFKIKFPEMVDTTFEVEG